MRSHYNYDEEMREMKEGKTVQYQLDRIKSIAEDVLSLHRFGYNRVSPYSNSKLNLNIKQNKISKEILDY